MTESANSTRVMLEPTFVLHSRPYRNSSLIVELFTRRFGRMVVVARSARGPRSRYQGRLQLFSPLLVSWSGRGDLKNLGEMESNGAGYQLEGQALLCGFYLNELLVRLLKYEDPYPTIYHHYQSILNYFEKKDFIETDLRYFEKNLLKELGYELSLNYDVINASDINPKQYYRYDPDRGFIQVAIPDNDPALFPGHFLQAFDQEALETIDDCRLAKRLMRLALARHLGEKPLHTRTLW